MAHILALHASSDDDTLRELTTVGMPELEEVSVQQSALGR
jgi:hypothetical protein